MKCPHCGHINNWEADRCQMCQAGIDHLRNRVTVGHQFVFLDASPEKPIPVGLTPPGSHEMEEGCLTQPTIVSRYQHILDLGETLVAEKRLPSDFVALRIPPPFRLPPFPMGRSLQRRAVRVYLPALDTPSLNLMAVVSDRAIYNPGETAHIFIAAPGAAGREAELEVRRGGQAVYQSRVTLNQAGLYLGRYPDLEEGEYRVVVTSPEPAGARAEYHFLCTRFDPSALKVKLDSHAFGGGELIFVLRLTQAGEPYVGPVDLALRLDEHKIYQDQRQVRDGRLKAGFRFKKPASGVLTIQVTAPDGKTAATILPSMGWEQLGKAVQLKLSGMDPPVQVALHAWPDAEAEVRGLHYGPAGGGEDDEEPALFSLEGVVGSEGRIQARCDASLVQVLILDPLGGQPRTFEYRQVKAGDVLSFEVSAPYVVFTLGAFTSGRLLPYEAWGTVIRPVALRASLDVPQAASPGAIISARIETDRPAHCLLLVYDARLEHEDPLTRLAQRIFVHLFEMTCGLWTRRVGRTLNLLQPGSFEWDKVMRGGGLSGRRMAILSYLVKGLGLEDIPVEGVAASMFNFQTPNLAPMESPATRRAAMLARREDSPELAHIELFPVDGRVEVPVRLGDHARTWRCRAYFFHGYDYVSETRDIEVVG
jgi:hypothetical protein